MAFSRRRAACSAIGEANAQAVQRDDTRASEAVQIWAELELAVRIGSRRVGGWRAEQVRRQGHLALTRLERLEQFRSRGLSKKVANTKHAIERALGAVHRSGAQEKLIERALDVTSHQELGGHAPREHVGTCSFL
jgi:hypothetical protein